MFCIANTVAGPLAHGAVTAPAAPAAILAGAVSDPTGALILSAEVQLDPADGSVPEQKQQTTRAGAFRFEASAGTYILTVHAPGFVTYSSAPLTLGPNAKVHVPVRLAVAARAEQIDVGLGQGDWTDSNSSGDGLVFEGKTLDLLSDSDATLRQQLNALAGGYSGAQYLIDGFSGGRLPPKSSIRSIRINNSPYSAYYDSFGFGRVEISTKPGGKQLHGGLEFNGTNQPFNAPNPYAPGSQPPYYQWQTAGTLNGPLGKNTSFFASDDVQLLANNATVNATVLSGLEPIALSSAIPAPQRTDTYSVRVDHQFSPTHFGYVRDEWSRTHTTNSGINPLVLPEAAFAANTLTNSLQLSDTVVVSPHAVNEARFQYIRSRLRQDPNSAAPSLVVQSSFQGGGSPAQVLRDNQDRFEMDELFDFDHGKHSIRAGFRFRELRNANVSSANFNGQYVFPDLTTYQRTEANLAACQTAGQTCLTPTQLRAAGGGASQFSLTLGDPAARLLQSDLGAFAEDDWKLTRSFTLSYGLRFESESAIPDHFDPAPRVGFAWAIRRAKKPVPVITFRGGYGIFYDRFPATNLLQAIRQNGSREIGYFVQNPDTYPAIPSTSILSATQPTIYRVSPNLKSSYQQNLSLTASRTIAKMGSVSGTFVLGHGTHGFLSRNVNAPLPGSFDPNIPNSGVRPLGASQNIYEYASDSNRNEQTFFLNTNLQVRKYLTVFAVYGAYRTHEESTGVNSFPADQYNLRADYAPSTGSHAQTLYSGLTWNMPYGFELNPFLSAHSGARFDITTGTDLNGDTVYNDRPAFATDLTRRSVVSTPFGTFDTQPMAGQQIIPRNYGSSPGFVWFDMILSRDTHLGPRHQAVTSGSAQGGAGPAGAAQRAERPWVLRFQVEAQNVFNHNNPGMPVGVIGLQPCLPGALASCKPQPSPYFGRSLSLANDFTPLTASNRTILLRSTFTF